MALVKCKECGAQVSNKATACPSCGAARPQTSLFTKLITGFLIVGGALSMAGYLSAQKKMESAAQIEAARVAQLTPQERAEEERRAELQRKRREAETVMYSAKAECKAHLAARLKDPKSAEWPSLTSFPGQILKNGLYDIQAQVRSKNSFGATVPEFLNCRLKRTGDAWAVIKLSR